MDKVSFMPADHAPKPPPRKLSVPQVVSDSAQHLLHREAQLTHSGRAAMTALFKQLELRREDEIFVTTTFDFPNVSSCVTCTIFNFCKPSRILTKQTRAIFVIHEFGAPHAQTRKLQEEARRRGIPLIEDCAHTIDSVSREGWRVGELGDWVIVSLPKILPTLHGGLLVGPRVSYKPSEHENEEMMRAGETAAAWWPLRSEHMTRRRELFRELTHRVRKKGMKTLLTADPCIAPWFFPICARRPDSLVARARARKVDCGLWHGTNIVVLPCHQFLAQRDIDRIVDAASDPEGQR